LHRVEKIARALVCDELGKKNCTEVQCQLVECPRTYRGVRSRYHLKKADDLTFEAVRYRDGANGYFEAERRSTEAARHRAMGEVGLNLSAPTAEHIRSFCVENRICIHDARLLLNCGLAQTSDSSDSPIVFRRSLGVWYDLVSLLFFAICLFLLGGALFVCTRFGANTFYAIAFSALAVVSVLLAIRGPGLQLGIYRRVRMRIQAA
jgi:hypothetical protein